MRKAIVAVAAMGLGVTTLLGHPSDARADEIAGLPKATVGGGFLGAEVVAIPMAIAGVSAGWAYAVFPGLGAIGGAIGGYFVDQAYGSGGSSSAGTQQPAYGSTFMLAGGMALIIPTIVLMLNATRYHPSAEATEDHAPTNVGPEANPGKTGGSAVTPSGGGGTTETPTSHGGTTAPPPPPPYVPLSLVDVHGGSLRMGIPIPEVHNAYSMREIKELGVRQSTELRVPVFKLAF
jgi:hypothetical protein